MALLSCESLVVELPSKEGARRVVDGVSFSLEAGEVYDLNGPSGCGKTTTLLACARMVPILSGTLLLDGRPSSDFAPDQWRRRVCLVPQKAEMVPGTVRDNLLAPWRLQVRKGHPAPDEGELRNALDRAMLADVELDRDASRLSGGQAARVALLRSFLTEPDILLLDEVDAALDQESSLAISAMTQEQADRGAAVLRIRHREPDGVAAKAFRMLEGRLVQ